MGGRAKGKHAVAGANVYWPDGTSAGVAQADLPLDLFSSQRGEQQCFVIPLSNRILPKTALDEYTQSPASTPRFFELCFYPKDIAN